MIIFKYAMHSGPHPSLVVDCPECGSPAGHFCNRDGVPADKPHEARRIRAGTAVVWLQTWRTWGSSRTLRGNAHAFLRDGPGPMVALCGYAPSAKTRLFDFPDDDPPPPCERCLQRQRNAR